VAAHHCWALVEEVELPVLASAVEVAAALAALCSMWEVEEVELELLLTVEGVQVGMQMAVAAAEGVCCELRAESALLRSLEEAVEEVLTVCLSLGAAVVLVPGWEEVVVAPKVHDFPQKVEGHQTWLPLASPHRARVSLVAEVVEGGLDSLRSRRLALCLVVQEAGSQTCLHLQWAEALGIRAWAVLEEAWLLESANAVLGFATSFG
jgi:hypothetical protein